MKGGVGKTSLSVALAGQFALMGKRVVIIDCDVQGNSTSWLLGDEMPDRELAGVLLGDYDVAEATVPYSQGVSIVPTLHSDLLGNYARTGSGNEPYAIADLTEDLDADVVMLDLGPGMGALERAALLATDEVVLVMTPEYFAIDGVSAWASQAKALEKGMRATLNYSRLVVNGLNRSIEQMVRITAEAKTVARHTYTIVQDPVFRKAQEQHVLPQSIGLKAENDAALIKLAEDLYG